MKKAITVIAVSIFTLSGFSVFGQAKINLAKGEKIKKNNNTNLSGIFYKKGWIVPCKYDKLEAFDSSRFLAFHGNEVDIYSNDLLWGKKSLEKNLPVKLLNSYMSLKNSGIYPMYSNGKWGFIDGYTGIVSPKYDSLFPIIREGSYKHDHVLTGISLDGSIGFYYRGKLFLEKDYNKIRYWLTGGGKGAEVITFTHKSGVDVTFKVQDIKDKANGFRDIKYIETKNNSGLKGFVSYGEFIEPQYTAIQPAKLQVADFECTLPDGSVEYRKGSRIIPADVVNEDKKKIALEEKKRTEALKKEAEIAAKEKAQFEMKKDSLKNELVSLFFKNHKSLYDKTGMLYEYLKSTMVVDERKGIDYSRWRGQAGAIKVYCKEDREQLKAYETDINRFQFVAGKIDLYDATTAYLKEVNAFIGTSESWADAIYTLSVSNEEFVKWMGSFEERLKNMNKTLAVVQGIVKESLNSRKK